MCRCSWAEGEDRGTRRRRAPGPEVRMNELVFKPWLTEFVFGVGAGKERQRGRRGGREREMFILGFN